jgi:hypothetical protein
MHRLAFTIGMALVMSIGARATAQAPLATDPWAGRWNLNIAKSTIRGEPPKQEFVTIARTGSDTLAFRYSVTGTAPDGTPFSATYDGRKDGKFYPDLVNGKETSKLSCVRESSSRTRCQINFANGTTGAETITLSDDGASFTVHQHIKGKDGEYDETHVFEKA